MASDVSRSDPSPRPDVSPWKLGGLSVKALGKRVWKEMNEDEVFDRAAGLSYYFLFALFPALLFLTSLLGLLPIPDLMDRLMGYLAQALPGDAASMLQKTLSEIVTGAKGSLLSIGALAALWAASNGMSSMMNALNVAYDVEDTRPWWKRRLVAVLLTLGFSLLILSALVLLVFGPKIGGGVAGWFGLGRVFEIVWNTASVPLVIFFVLVGIALVYYFAPATKTHWRWVTPGSVVALVLWLGMSFGLRLYVSQFGNYGATYGSIGGVILLMLWLYLTGVVLLVGAEINAEIEHAAAERGEVTAKAPGEHAPPVEGGAPADRAARPAAVPRDVRIAGEALVERYEVLRERGWLPVLALAVAAIAGFMLRHKSVKEVAGTGAEAVETGRNVAAAIAAIERFRGSRDKLRRAA